MALDDYWRQPEMVRETMAEMVSGTDGCIECGYQFGDETEGCDECKPITDLLKSVHLTHRGERM